MNKLIHSAEILEQLDFKKIILTGFLIEACTHPSEFLLNVPHKEKYLVSIQCLLTVTVFLGNQYLFLRKWQNLEWDNLTY